MTRDPQRGQAVILAYGVVLLVTILGGSLLDHGLSVQRLHERQRAQAEMFYVAEGGVEDAIGRFSQAIADFVIDANVARYPTVGTLNTVFSSGATASWFVEQAEALPRLAVDPDGTTIFEKNYHIQVTAQHPAYPSVQVTHHQLVTRRVIYTFQHAIFYDHDLEWLPGPNMTLSGRVHSNSDLYIGTHNTLTVDSGYLHAVGSIFNKRKDSTDQMEGTVLIKKLGTSTFYPMDGLDSSKSNWTTESQDRWGGTVKSSVHGVTKLAAPVVGSIQPGGFYDVNAGLKVVNQTLTRNGIPLVPGTDVPPGTVATSTTLYNNREGKYVKMTDLNLRRLAGYYDCNGDGVEEQCYPNQLPANGLIYVTRDDAPASQQPGVRLLKGQEISRTGGLTVASSLPLYIQGDYNTVGKKPSAVIADAVSLLSNNWKDANSAVNNVNSGSSRTATPTTINTAFLAGIRDTAGSQYSGGVENYPRLHERWDGVTLSIRGAFVSLWNSQIATGGWKYGQQSSNSQYTAPNRNWNYDTDFSSGTNMPPFTPWAVEIRKKAWWRN